MKTASRMFILVFILAMITFSMASVLAGIPPGAEDRAAYSPTISTLALSKAPKAEPLIIGDAGDPLTADSSAAVEIPSPVIATNNEESPVPADDPGGGSTNISDSVDNLVKIALIPLLVFILGLIKVSWDKNRFTLILMKLWGLIKDCDNYFANPGAAERTSMEMLGVNAAKKQWVIDSARKLLSEPERKLVRKKAGGIGNAIEMAFTMFKYGAPIIGGLAKMIKKL